MCEERGVANYAAALDSAAALACCGGVAGVGVLRQVVRRAISTTGLCHFIGTRARRPRSLMGVSGSGEIPIQRMNQFMQVGCRGLPNLVNINFAIIVNDDVAHPLHAAKR